MVERGVRFVQVYHNNWDHHANVAGRLPSQCKDVDQACWGLVQDLKARGLFDETLVIWGGEFGRTIYSQGGLSHDNYGRDHHPRCFTMWMAGGGTKAGTIYGETDEFSYNIVKDPVHIRDFHATVLQLLGFDHRRFSYRYPGPGPASHRRRAGTRGQGIAGLSGRARAQGRGRVQTRPSDSSATPVPDSLSPHESRKARRTNRFSDRQREATRMNLAGLEPLLVVAGAGVDSPPDEQAAHQVLGGHAVAELDQDEVRTRGIGVQPGHHREGLEEAA